MLHWLLAYFQAKVQSNNYQVRCLAPWTRVISYGNVWGFSHISVLFLFFLPLYIHKQSQWESMSHLQEGLFTRETWESVLFIFVLHLFLFDCVWFFYFLSVLLIRSCNLYLSSYVFPSVCPVSHVSIFVYFLTCVKFTFFFSSGLHVCHFLFHFDSPSSHMYHVYSCLPSCC